MFDSRTQKHDHHSYDNMGANNSCNMERTRLSPSDEREEVIQFRTNHDGDDDDQESTMGIDDSGSGVCTPPLWKSSPSSQPLLSHHIHTSLSPNSRVQAIARGQRELMEMVKSMPESSYELSLKDLVESHRMGNQERLEDSRSIKLQGRVKRQESKRDDNKNVSFQDKGLFIKMVLPFSLKKSSKKKIGGRVSPKPEGERDWWKKNKFTGSSDSDRSKTSVDSGSSRYFGGFIWLVYVCIVDEF